MFRCDAYYKIEKTRTRTRTFSCVCRLRRVRMCVCVCVWLCSAVVKRTQNSLFKTNLSLFVFNATRSFEYVPPALVYIDDAVTRAREKR